MATPDQIRFEDRSSESYRYIWPNGPNGVPLRTRTPNLPLLKPEELEALVEVEDAHVEVLRLDQPEDLKRYRQILDGACKGHSTILFTERRWDESVRNWTVLIEYATAYEELPSHGKPKEHGPILDFQAGRD